MSCAKPSRSRWLLATLSALLSALVLAACATEDNTPTERQDRSAIEQVTTGEDVYARYCSSCHGPNGEGQRPDAPLQKDETGRFPAPPHDETGHTWHHDDDLLFQIVRDGGMGDDDFYEMPGFGYVLSDQEIQAVLAFIKTMWTNEQRAAQQARTEAAHGPDNR